MLPPALRESLLHLVEPKVTIATVFMIEVVNINVIVFFIQVVVIVVVVLNVMAIKAIKSLSLRITFHHNLCQRIYYPRYHFHDHHNLASY